MASAKSFVRLSAMDIGFWEVRRSRPEASDSLLVGPVREYSARNWSTERISTTDSGVGLGGWF